MKFKFIFRAKDGVRIVVVEEASDEEVAYHEASSRAEALGWNLIAIEQVE